MNKLEGRMVKVTDPMNLVAHLKGEVGVITIAQDYTTATYPIVVAFPEGFSEAFRHDELRYLNHKQVIV